MCDVIIPALLGVAALGLLGGGIGGDCGNPCAAPAQCGGYCITIPQQVGDVTNGMPVGASPQYAYSQPQQMPAYGQRQQMPAYGGANYPMAPQYPAPAYGGESMGHYGQAPAPYYGGAGMDAGVDIGGQSGVGAGGYANPGGVGFGANVGGLDASVGMGARSY